MKINSLYNAVKEAGEVIAFTEGLGSNPLSDTFNDLALGLNGHDIKWSLIGGLAVGFYAKPRGTQDIDVMLISDDHIEMAHQALDDNFKRHRKHAFEHKRTGVEVEIITPNFVNIPSELVEQIIGSSVIRDGVPIASRDGVIAAKLQRGSLQDMADIEAILRKDGPADLSGFTLASKQLDVYKSILKGINDI